MTMDPTLLAGSTAVLTAIVTVSASAGVVKYQTRELVLRDEHREKELQGLRDMVTELRNDVKWIVKTLEASGRERQERR